MHPDEIIKVLRERSRRYPDKVYELKDLAEKVADAEKEHAMAFATKMTELKLSGTPVTALKDLVRGDKAVAELKRKYEIAKGVHEACKLAMKGILEDMGIYRSILSYEKSEIQGS